MSTSLRGIQDILKKLGNREFNINKIFKRQKVELNKIEEGLTIMSLDSAYEK